MFIFVKKITMTLKEKLEVEIMDLPIMSEVIDDIGKNLEYVADDFAIGFAEWVDDKGLEVVLNQKPKNTKELLEIYKKEKGL
jgi:hypothetical protein